MAAIVLGLHEWDVEADDEGQRSYTATWLIESAVSDGPQTICNAAGLPTVGSTWAFGADSDPWAFCKPNYRARPRLTGEPNSQWLLTQTFSTKPSKRCQDSTIEDPLSEPAKMSGSFIKYTREATRDRHGNRLLTSSLEMIRGALAERDDNRPTVNIGLNSSSLNLGGLASIIDHVNDSTMWGLPARCIKLMNAPWERNLYGTCSFYYTVNYQFEIKYDTFDTEALDEGTMVLPEGLDPDGIDATTGKAYKLNPKRFVQYKDRLGENARVLLNGSGQALSDGESPVGIQIEHYDETNFLLLGIPSSL